MKNTLATSKIYELFALGSSRKSIHPSCVGVEVEAEMGEFARFSDKTSDSLNENGVYVTTDGSLRNGYEFITRPIELENVKGHPAFKAIGKALNDIKAREDSPRTSTHVHLNMSSSTFLQVVNFAVTYWSLEQVLLRICDEYRRGNMFALSITDSQTMLEKISEAFETNVRPKYSENEFKYSSFNFVPLSKLGTVEIRIMHGLTREGFIEDWAILCGAIRSLSFEFDTPNDVLALEPKELYKKFMNKLDDNNYWKGELQKLNPDLYLEWSREILALWACNKTKDYWYNYHRKGQFVRSKSLDTSPETDFTYEESPWTPIDLDEDV